MVNAILMPYQMEIKNMLLETGRKAVLVIKVAKNLVELCSRPSIFWKVELANRIIWWNKFLTKCCRYNMASVECL